MLERSRQRLAPHQKWEALPKTLTKGRLEKSLKARKDRKEGKPSVERMYMCSNRCEEECFLPRELKEKTRSFYPQRLAEPGWALMSQYAYSMSKERFTLLQVDGIHVPFFMRELKGENSKFLSIRGLQNRVER